MSNARDKANIPALNFSSTGIDDNATSTAITIDSSENVGIGTTSTQGKLLINTGASGSTLNPSSMNDGNISFSNASGATAVPTIVGRSNNNSGLLLIGTSNNSQTGGDLVFDVRENDNTDFATLTGSGFKFSRLGNELMRLTRDGKLGIGTSSPSQPLHVEGIALSKPKLGLFTFGGSGAPNADRERARQGLWRASSDRGAWSLASPAGGIDYSAFSTSTNNSYIVWDLLVTNCSEIVVRMFYANSADASTRSVVSQYSVDGGSTYTTLGTGTFGAGGADCGGTITFSNSLYLNQTYVKIRTAFTSGAPLNSTLRQYIGLKEVFFTPLCSSVSYQKCLG